MTTIKVSPKASDIFESNLESLLTYSMPTNGIAQSGVPAAYERVKTMYLYHRDNNIPLEHDTLDILERVYLSLRDIIFALDSDYDEGSTIDQWNHWVITKGEYAGTWPKRFKTYMFKNYGVRLSPELTSKIGEIISRHSLADNKEYYFSLVHFCDWNPGDFNESSGSCWWDSYNASRLALIDNGGGACLFYLDAEQYHKFHKIAGIGRFWYWPDRKSGSVYIFNAYGKDSLLSYARILSAKFGLSYKKVSFDYEDSYVNGDSAYEIYTDNPNGDYTLRLDLSGYDYGYTCEACGDRFNRDDGHEYDGDIYCDECYHERFDECMNCGRTAERDDMYTLFNYDIVCDRCYSRYYTQCDVCQEIYPNGDITNAYNSDVVQINVCDGCLAGYFTECKECGDYHANEVMSDDDLCPDCAEESSDDDTSK